MSTQWIPPPFDNVSIRRYYMQIIQKTRENGKVEYVLKNVPHNVLTEDLKKKEKEEIDTFIKFHNFLRTLSKEQIIEYFNKHEYTNDIDNIASVVKILNFGKKRKSKRKHKAKKCRSRK